MRGSMVRPTSRSHWRASISPGRCASCKRASKSKICWPLRREHPGSISTSHASAGTGKVATLLTGISILIKLREEALDAREISVCALTPPAGHPPRLLTPGDGRENYGVEGPSHLR
jgi:hypothetical protein